MLKYRFIKTILFSAIMIALISCNGAKKAGVEEAEEVLPENIVEMRDDQIKLANIETGSIEMR